QVLRIGHQQRGTELEVHPQAEQRPGRQVVLVAEVVAAVAANSQVAQHQPRQRQTHVVTLRTVEHHPETNQRIRLHDVFPKRRVHRVQLRKLAVVVGNARIQRQTNVLALRYADTLGKKRTRLRQLLHGQAFMTEGDPRRGTHADKAQVAAAPEYLRGTFHAHPLAATHQADLAFRAHQARRWVNGRPQLTVLRVG